MVGGQRSAFTGAMLSEFKAGERWNASVGMADTVFRLILEAHE
jgi:hypothetical protein